MKRPVPPSNFATKDALTRVDLDRLRRGFQELLDWIAANKTAATDLSTYGTIASNDGRYLLRAAADFASFSHKSSPVSADKILLEDSAASGAKKWAALSDLATAIGTSFDPIAGIAPEFYWRASNPANTIVSGKCTVLAALGSDSTTLNTAGVAAPVVGTDSNGNTYHTFSSIVTTKMQQSGAASKFQFLHDGSTPWTIIMVHDSLNISSAGLTQTPLDTSLTSSGNPGVTMNYITDGGGSNRGFTFGVFNGSLGNYVNGVYALTEPVARARAKAVHVFRLYTSRDATVTFGVPVTFQDMQLIYQGDTVAVSAHSASQNYSTSAPAGLLTLGASGNAGIGHYWDANFYELMIVKRALSDRLLYGMYSYINTTYGIAV